MATEVENTFTHALVASIWWPQFGVGGRYFTITEADYPVDVRLHFDDGATEIYSNKKAGWFYNAFKVFGDRSQRITGYELRSDQAQTVMLDLSEHAETGRIPVDQLEVNDTTTGRAVALRGEAFGWDRTKGATAAEFNASQIKNPVGSGKNVVVKMIGAYSSAGATSYRIGRWTGADLAVDDSASVFNKKPGSGVASEVEAWHGTVTVDNPAGLSTIARLSSEVALKVDRWDGRDKEMVIAPGESLMVVCQQANTNTAIFAEWEEEDA